MPSLFISVMSRIQGHQELFTLCNQTVFQCYLISGTVRLSVHSWEFTKESGEKLVRIGMLLNRQESGVNEKDAYCLVDIDKVFFTQKLRLVTTKLNLSLTRAPMTTFNMIHASSIFTVRPKLVFAKCKISNNNYSRSWKILQVIIKHNSMRSSSCIGSS